VPLGSVHFVGRENELLRLHKELTRGKQVAIAGMGGIGKTELAIQYIKKFTEVYEGIVWFNARETNIAGKILEFFSLELGLKIPQYDRQDNLLTPGQQVEWCWSKYPETERPILIVFDDVTDLAHLSEAIPIDNRFRVLVTTRLRNLDPSLIQEITLEVLSLSYAKELLKQLLEEKDRRVENEPEAATDICKVLGCLPLGIELVGGYLRKDSELFLSLLLQRLKDQRLAEKALQDKETLNLTQLGVKAAFNLTWSELDSLTQQLGKFLSLFSPQQILWELVVWVATKQEDNSLIWSKEELNEARKQLYEYNLLQKGEEPEGYYKIHPLVQWFLQEELEKSDETRLILEKIFALAMVTTAQTIPSSPTSEDIEFFRDVIPHLEELTRRLITKVRKKEQINSPLSVPNDKVIWIFVGVERFYEGQGLYKLAEPWSRECLEVCLVLFNGDHHNVADSLNNLAGNYHSQGRYSEAEPLYSEALVMRKRLFNGDHHDVADSLNNLAALYNGQGRYSEAEPLYSEALVMRKRLFNGDHHDVANSLNNLAVLYYSQGRYSEAEPLYSEALEMIKLLFNGDHPHEALSLNNLAALYYSQGRYSEAEDHYTKALAMRKRLFKGDHPDVATSLNDLAGLYHRQGRYSEAEPLYSEALEMIKRLFNGDRIKLE